MKFLITGAYGFVGTNLCKYLVEKGHECHALDVPTVKRDDVPYSSFTTWDGLTEFITHHSSLPTPFDAVVHLAGKAHDLKKVASEQSYFDINVGLTEKIFNAFARHGSSLPRSFIYFSSSKASADGNAYGRSKLAAEEFLRSSCASHPSPMQVVILRPAMIHGPGNKGNLNLLWGVARRGIPWPLAAFENKRSFTSIGNICAAVEAIAERTEERNGMNGGDTLFAQHSPLNIHTFGVADDDMLSTNRLMELITETCGKRARLWRLPKGLMRLGARIGDVLHLPLTTERIEKLTEDSFVDNSQLKRMLGWQKMPIAAEDGMRLTLKSFMKGGSRE